MGKSEAPILNAAVFIEKEANPQEMLSSLALSLLSAMDNDPGVGTKAGSKRQKAMHNLLDGIALSIAWISIEKVDGVASTDDLINYGKDVIQKRLDQMFAEYDEVIADGDKA